MRTIATLQDADNGSISLDSIDAMHNKDAMRQVLGYLPQEFGVYPTVSAEELLDHIAILKGITNNAQRKEVVTTLLKQTNLYEHRKKNLGGYSGGMKQRFGIAQALLGNPKIIIVDEPTAGLDPTERNRFLNLLSEISETVVVILSTHIVEDVRELCPNMAIINKGEVMFTGTPQAALDKLHGKVYKAIVPKNEAKQISEQYKVISTKFNTGNIEVHILSSQQPQNPAFEQVAPELEDVYFAVINKLID